MLVVAHVLMSKEEKLGAVTEHERGGAGPMTAL